MDLAALDAEFRATWATTDRAGTDAWLDALAARAPIEIHAPKAEEFRAWVGEKRAVADAKRVAEEAEKAEAVVTPEAVEVVEQLPPEVVARRPSTNRRSSRIRTLGSSRISPRSRRSR